MNDSAHQKSPTAAVGSHWVGASALAGGKGYVEGPLGQLHYRNCGSGSRTPFLLIHQTPLGMAQFVDVQRELSVAGRRSIAIDNPGYGYSDPAPNEVDLAAIADHLAVACERLGLPPCIVAGHHTGAAMACVFAANHPERTAGLILHGVPLYDASERAERLARPVADLSLREDGRHFVDIFRGVGRHAGIDTQSLSSVTWATLGVFLAASPSPLYRAVFAHDLAPDLAAVRAPTLVLTDRADVLHENDLRAVALRPDFAFEHFSAGGSFAMMREPSRWAQTILRFADQFGL